MLVTTQREFVEQVRHLLHRALDAGTREIFCADPDFADWPFNEPALVDALTRWARPPRRLVLLAAQYDEVRRRHPRFVQWHRTWGHVVEARAPAPDAPAVGPVPRLLLAGQAVLEVLDGDAWRGKVSTAAEDVVRGKARLDAILQHSEPAFAATTLGL